jgi:hypothetical protein
MWVTIENALLGLNVKLEIFSEKEIDMVPLGERESKRRRPDDKIRRRLRYFLPFFDHV